MLLLLVTLLPVGLTMINRCIPPPTLPPFPRINGAAAETQQPTELPDEDFMTNPSLAMDACFTAFDKDG